MEVEDRWKKPLKTPIGVYVWTILVILKFGVGNFISFLLALRSIEGDVAIPTVVVSFALCFFTAIAAVFALLGENVGRIALLILTPLNLIWVVLLVIPALLGQDIEAAKAAVFVIIQQVFLALPVIGMEWYFMTKNVVEYYKQNG